MKKGILLFITLLLVSGCSCDFHLKIDEQYNFLFQEDIKIIPQNSEEEEWLRTDPWPINAFFDDLQSSEEPTPIEGVAYYRKNFIKQDKSGYLNLTNTFNAYEYRRAFSVNTCFKSFYYDYNEYDNITRLSTSNEFLCMEKYPYLDQVNIIVEINNNVQFHNADKTENNRYIWTIDRNNYKNKYLELSYEGGYNYALNIKASTEKEKKESTSQVFLVLIILLLFLLFIGFLFYYNVKKQNEKRG